jgi:hypothetical protein
MGDPKMYTLKVEGGKIGDFTGIQIQFSQEEGEENTALKDAITPLLTPPAQPSSTVQQSNGGRRRKRRTKVKSKKRAHRRKRTRHQH